MALYRENRSSVRVAGETSVNFGIEVGVHQGSVLSPLLFIVVMEEATKECRVDNPWELLYADDLVLTAERRLRLCLGSGGGLLSGGDLR